MAARRAHRLSDTRPEQTQVVVNLGGGADGRPRIARGGLLTDGDGRRDAVDPVDIRLFHALEELSSVRGEGLDVPALPFGVNRVKRQRRLARAADARHDDEAPVWQ